MLNNVFHLSIGPASILILSLVALNSFIHGQQFEIGSTPNPVGSGARALGLGNAFIAVVDDATAASWNPAGLLQLESSELSLAIEYLTRTDKVKSTTIPENHSDNSIELNDLNYASIAIPFYLWTNMVLSINYLNLYRFDKSLSLPIEFSDGLITPRAQLEFDQEGSLAVVAPAYAVAITNRFFLGLTVNFWDDSLTQSSSYKKKESTVGSIFSIGPPQSFRSQIKNRFIVDHGKSFVIGALYRINDQWSTGAVIKPSFTLGIDHKRSEVILQSADTDRPEPLSTVKNSEFNFPWIIGGGIAWRPQDPITLSFDMTWTDWSEFVFKEDGLTTNPISGRPTSDGRLDDTLTYRMGCEYLWIREKAVFPIRWGASYDPTPSIDNSDDFFTLNFGTGVQIGRYNFDIAYQFRWGNNVNEITFQGFDASEDSGEHRVLSSLIYYF